MVTDLLLRIALAGLLGGLIGLERQLRAKEAGLRTHILVGIGSAMFMIVSKYGFEDILLESHVALDPSRIAAQVVSGMGFLGAGTIIIQKQIVKGLTTAAGMWVTAAIGLVIGSGLYEIGIYGAFLTLVVLEVFRQLSNRLLSRHCGLLVRLSPQSVSRVFTMLQTMSIRFDFRSLKENPSEDKAWELFLVLTLRPGKSISNLCPEILKIEGVKSVAIR
ncbi:MgtC/SapB family protein [Salmonella enterica]|uniref:Protein MgtC n=2 Tax=Salmonella enterica subsp. enterica serovar Bareilly TaxID=58096 RepID=A0A5U9SIZ4_SALET|nr:MgtC/SapB family protein [Salmonella enterica]EBR8899618.1 MgtC/SapB family protein [Salmonella enterica subsp. enterica serovar Java]EBY6770848.1 MgtC/SapB family protein [Salmonella enterica subsp. enterica serovar Richmond]ECH9869700.1 MgtC/SapB family protein [Salmonella enterica subsp. enterica]EDC2011329.1 MgtC/SapB family protein [Salmonella enterica subsp. enterica serovar Paratyphi B]EEO3206894.1 MgtC/SapB family protein [Salmonella enterica subsp. enterica serovar Montevideo]KDR0